jgi:hypothetical protein
MKKKQIKGIEKKKVIQGHNELKYFKNYFINLALPFISSSEPMSVQKNKVSFGD